MQKSADTMDHDGREAAANENCPPQEVSNLWDCEMGKRLGREWEEVAKFLRKSHKNLISIVEETKASKQAKACIELEWSRLVEELGKLHRGRGKNTPEALVTSTSATMAERGIESEEDWKDYVATMERDGEIVSDLSEMLNVNTLQIKDCVADLLRQDADRKVAGMLEPKAQESLSYNHARQDNRPLQESLYLTGPTFAESWRRRSAEEAAPKQEGPGRVAKVNQIEPKEKEPSRDGRSLSSIINEARCMGMKISGKGSEESDLIGERLTISLKVLGEQCQALVDTGSMISIVPVELLAKAQDKGVDLDSLSMIPKAKLKK
nr:unnamed protein product [Haemonchus contortus]